MKIRQIAPTLLALLISASLAACAGHYGSSASVPVRISSGMLAGSNGMTLYTFDKDMAGSGKSVCNGPCATNWPPLLAMESDQASGDYSIIMRDDGKKQWAFKGKPLHFWVKDQKPGDTSGDGFNNLWRVAKP